MTGVAFTEVWSVSFSPMEIKLSLADKISTNCGGLILTPRARQHTLGWII